MVNMIEKSFKNEALGFELTSYIDKQQNVWFKGKEVAKILGYSNVRKAIWNHVDSEDKKQIFTTHTSVPKTGTVAPSGSKCTYINESGFYSLVLSSKLETAKKFKKWVTSEVLPSLRKYGYFKLFKLENETRIKQRVIIDGVKYYSHPVFDNYAASKNGDIISLKNKRIISKKRNNGKGYLNFSLCNEKLEEKKNYYQHRFVFEVFKGMIPSIMEIDHRNGVKNDNRIKNLQLITPYQNKNKANNKPIISTCISTGKEKRFVSIRNASIDLDIFSSLISQICKGKFKSATSKKDGRKYLFKYLD